MIDEYWESKTFLDLEEPEYRAGITGRLDWLVNNYNGTKENPNKDALMRSPTMRIGDYEIRMKFFPKGNDTDFMSVYVECPTVQPPPPPPPPQTIEGPAPEGVSESEWKKDDAEMSGTQQDEEGSQSEPEYETQFTPLPLLDGKTVVKRKSFAAQVSVLCYNPEEPRVNVFRTALHRFCPESPDWGWTRYHGPLYDIRVRHRGSRQALLRNDKLAFRCYIRLIEDDTECLGEHSNNENPWNSLRMTGLQGLSTSENSIAPGGNLISAISAWMLFKPFREFLYQCKSPDPIKEPKAPPAPILAALQKILYMLRTPSLSGTIGLEDLTGAFEYYGINEKIEKMDVVEIWDLLRTKLDQETVGTDFEGYLDDMFRTPINSNDNYPKFRVPVRGSGSVQDAMDKAQASATLDHSPPQLLTVELLRQEFDEKARSFKKLANRIMLNEVVKFDGIVYYLYGQIVHRENLQSSLYHSVLRPDRYDGKWYQYSDGKDENRVTCLPKRLATEALEGSENGNETDAVTYILLYVRHDVEKQCHEPETEPTWDVPQWIVDEVYKMRNPIPPPFIPDPLGISAWNASAKAKEGGSLKETRMIEFEVFDSRAFLDHEGPGIVNVFHPSWESGGSDIGWRFNYSPKHLYKVSVNANSTAEDFRVALASVIKEVEDPRQCRFWSIDTRSGSESRPNLISSTSIELFHQEILHKHGKFVIKDLQEKSPECRIWVHIVPLADLPPPPPAPEEIPVPSPLQASLDAPTNEPMITDAPQQDATPEVEVPATGQAAQSNENQSNAEVQVVQEVAVIEEATVPNEDTVMSEDGNVPEITENAPGSVTEAQSSQQQEDAVMAEVPANTDSTTAPGVEIITVPAPVLPYVPSMFPLNPPGMRLGAPPPDIDMGEAMPPPPPPPPDEIYIFLKWYNAESESLVSRGSFFVKKSDKIGPTILKLLHLPSGTPLDVFEEEEISTANPISRRRTFAQENVDSTAIIIATSPITDETKAAILARAKPPDPITYLKRESAFRNFPHQFRGELELAYFSSEYHIGAFVNRLPHGEGTHIYFSGDKYVGNFVQGTRAGNGVMTYASGDVYEGDWADGLQHGQGSYTDAETGNKYVGGWKQGKRFGEGVTHWKVAQETERLCRICYDDVADAAFYDCGHVVACLGCARRVESCPICRKRVLAAIKLFF
ncbi:hypothetical protein M501DRAFT_1022936 [Patellaria atrata CBS 101060]|uniref:RING-type domain-containing protein n=1 Tax=Patellaria atrata CBS 101060 TaxID=1346257 RepID=A0A9P4SF38_9PEZI|nr:hypothetical protein M501DRAFT_1022936 [Patellaria atrata CBS 101060]